MAILPPTSGQVLPAQNDFVSLSKVISIEVAFLGSIGFALFGHPTSDTLSFCYAIAESTGLTLGILKITDLVANIMNVRAFLGSASAAAAGVVPQAASTPLLATPPTTNGAGSGGSHGTTGAAAI